MPASRAAAFKASAIPRRSGSDLRPFGEGFERNPFEDFGQGRVIFTRQRQRVIDVFHQDGQRRIGVEGNGSGEGFVISDAEGVDVAADIAVAFQALFGGHVTQRAHEGAGDGILRSADDLGNAEVGEDGLSGAR